MAHVGNTLATDVRAARQKEYGKYIATEEIFIDGVLAFGKDYPVPIGHVEMYPELLEEGAVAEVQLSAPVANAKRDEWVHFARAQGAPEKELGPLKSGGLTRAALAEKYTPPEPAAEGDEV
jgi:hypothetical protein